MDPNGGFLGENLRELGNESGKNIAVKPVKKELPLQFGWMR